MRVRLDEPTADIRDKILGFERILANHPDSQFGDTEDLPVEHLFGGGMCIRQMFIPAGTIVVGKIHRHAHPNFLLQGEVIVVTEHGGREKITAPHSMISEPGTKRVVYALTDVLWAVVHKTDTTDPIELEHEVIAPSYEALEAPEELLRIGG
jgi:hypothetical protein